MGTYEEITIAELDRFIAERRAESVNQAVVQFFSERMHSSSLDWIFELGKAADHYGWPLTLVQSLASDLAWQARALGQRIPDHIEWNVVDELPDGSLPRRVVAYVEAQRYRYDFRFRDLEHGSNVWQAEFKGDALLSAFRAYALMGLQDHNAMEVIDGVLELKDANFRIRSMCLHGLWLIMSTEDHAHRLIRLAGNMIMRGEGDSNVYFRMAAAYRRLHKYDAAIDSIERAVTLLGPGKNDIHQDYVRERELIMVMRTLDIELTALAHASSESARETINDEITHARAEFDARLQAVHNIADNNIYKTVEILGLFMALAGFLLGTVSLAGGTRSLVEQGVLIAITAVGAIGFFAVLRFIVRHGSDGKH